MGRDVVGDEVDIVDSAERRLRHESVDVRCGLEVREVDIVDSAERHLRHILRPALPQRSSLQSRSPI